MKMFTMVKGAALALFAAGVVAAASAGCCCMGESKEIAMPKNEDFYKDGKFQADKAKDAYFAMMKRFNYPIPARLKTDEFWAIDFGLNDFAHVGMGGIFWTNYNHDGGGYLGHEIYLLPGQMIVEHCHVKCESCPPKRESWQVRHGSIYTFCEIGEAGAACPAQLPKSQEKHMVAKHWKLIKEGEIDTLPQACARHFMIAGPEGAIVTEYATYHDNKGLRFTNPDVKF